MSKKILLADDSLTIQKVVELTFMDEGFVVEAVGSGEEALSRFGEVEPDLVIADVHMPAPDGYGVCKEVKGRSPETPVLLLVGTFQPFDESEAEAAGANGFLKKPFDSQELFRRVEELVAAKPAESSPETDAPVETAIPEIPVGSQIGEPSPDTVETLEAVPLEEIRMAAANLDAAEAAAPPAETVPVEVPLDAEPTVSAPDLSDDQIDRIARRVAEILGDGILREISWEVVPDLAEIVIKDRLRDLESQLD